MPSSKGDTPALTDTIVPAPTQVEDQYEEEVQEENPIKGRRQRH